ncbi:unnamed protein product [Psylliodes chrysocephalus]|uniref:Regulatory protein zeste n=1 Tax=Psylliodes chrysocephalus TaxID=3402493 RepID=A0A9P0D017_9CUCU|nr:unnamed protein product [Psylliodes chrysocephala]
MEGKRNRSANFTDEEKVKLLALLQIHSDILCKKTDFTFNKKKETAWMKLVQDFNSNNNIKRNVDNLKKIWNKMKYEAKTYKSKLKVDVMGTGGGPSTLKENSILEEVLLLIGRAGVGIENIYDSDFQPAIVVDMDVGPIEPFFCENELTESKLLETCISQEPQVESGETSTTFQVPLVQSASTSRQITPSRRRPVVKASVKEQLSKEKVHSEKLKQSILTQELNNGVLRRSEERELFELEKRKAEQSIHLRSIILQKLENNEDVDPSLIQAIFKD